MDSLFVAASSHGLGITLADAPNGPSQLHHLGGDHQVMIACLAPVLAHTSISTIVELFRLAVGNKPLASLADYGTCIVELLRDLGAKEPAPNERDFQRQCAGYATDILFRAHELEASRGASSETIVGALQWFQSEILGAHLHSASIPSKALRDSYPDIVEGIVSKFFSRLCTPELEKEIVEAVYQAVSADVSPNHPTAIVLVGRGSGEASPVWVDVSCGSSFNSGFQSSFTPHKFVSESGRGLRLHESPSLAEVLIRGEYWHLGSMRSDNLRATAQEFLSANLVEGTTSPEDASMIQRGMDHALLTASKEFTEQWRSSHTDAILKNIQHLKARELADLTQALASLKPFEDFVVGLPNARAITSAFLTCDGEGQVSNTNIFEVGAILPATRWAELSQ